MKKYLILILILLYSCSGYTPIYSKKEINFSLEDISFNENNVTNNKIKQKLNRYSEKNSNDNNSNIFKINITSNFKKEITSKDKKGNPDSFKINLNLLAKITDENNKVYSLNFNESKTYKKGDQTEFELAQYEKVLEDNLINIVLEGIIQNIASLN